MPAESGPLDAEPLAALPPAKRYRLGAELGRGGMGRVVEALDLQLGRTVALKEVLASRNSAGIERRFAREVQITARLEHPAIVPLYDSGLTEDGRPFYVMRKVTGRPLEEMIARTRSVAERMAQLPAVLAAIDAVGHAHRRGVIHRDLKPANILVGELGETVVIDWGLAKVIGESDHAIEALGPADHVQTQIGSVFGTPGFMAPEQARGEELGTRGDVYALGATLYQLLAGVPPHRGKSATEVLSSTLSHGPLEVEAPGAPPELVAIVRKALAFEAAERYPDAVALGEDVRRFLAGQLVAAHQYTRRERLARIAKKYRGMLAVAAVATVALSGLAWYGVQRILDERDIANDARAVALRESLTAKERLVAVQDREERRIVANARALLGTSPTAAIATLKQIPARSKYVDEARTVAESAVARGVVWGQQTTVARTAQAILSPDGTRLFQLTDDTWARLWDLDRHKLVWQRHEADSRTHALWVGDGKHLILRHDNGPPVLVDVATVTSTALPIATMVDAVAAERGDRILFVAGDGAIHRFDVETRADVVLPVENLGKEARLAIAPDARTAAVTDGAKLVIVFGIDGAELARHAGAFHSLAFSDTGKLAAFGAPDVIELKLAPTPVWTVVAIPSQLHYGPAMGAYLGDELQVSVGSRVYSWDRRAVELMTTSGDVWIEGFAVAGGVAIAKLTEAKLRFANRYQVGELLLPMTVAHARLIGRPKLPRLVVVGEGILLDLPIEHLVARVLPKQPDEVPAFVGDDTLLYLPSAGGTLRWYDLTKQRETVVQLAKPGYHMLESFDEHDGRALVADMFGSVNGAAFDQAPTRLLLVKRGEATARTVAEGLGLWGLLVSGGGVVYVDGAGKLWGAIGDAPIHALPALDGAVVSIAGRGPLGYVAYTDAGELVRGALDRPTVEKIYARKSHRASLATDDANRAYLAIGTHVYRWDADLQEVADLGKPITELIRAAGGVLVGVDGGEFFLLPGDPVGPPRRVLSAGSTHINLGDGGHLLTAIGQGAELELVELPAQLRWTVPTTITPQGSIAISASGRTIVYSAYGGTPYSLIRRLEPSPTDLGAWLDELTNATADESGFIVWPWQAP